MTKSDARVEFVGEGAAVDRFAACTNSRRVACLNKHALHDAVERGAVIVAFSGSLDEVAHRLGRFFRPELHVNTAKTRVYGGESPHRGLRGVDGRHSLVSRARFSSALQFSSAVKFSKEGSSVQKKVQGPEGQGHKGFSSSTVQGSRREPQGTAGAISIIHSYLPVQCQVPSLP